MFFISSTEVKSENDLYFTGATLIFDHGQRISRALEYEVLSDTVTNILWEYSLPPNLFGHAGGSMKILNNNTVQVLEWKLYQ